MSSPYYSSSQNKQQRDLAWCLESPHLLNQQYLNTRVCADFCPPQVSGSIDLSSAPRIQPARRLGLYFEQLWQQLACRYFDQVIIAANKQIIHENFTLGALDLLSFCQKKQVYVHYELAVKFYLKSRNGDNLSDWIGPNSADRLDLKLDRLINHQLPLIHDPRARTHIDQWIEGKGMPSIDATGLHQQLVMKGWLFEHYQNANQREDGPFVNPDCMTGIWLHFNELLPWLTTTSSEYKHWILLPRLHWLSRLHIPVDVVKSLSNAELGQQTPHYLESPILLTSDELTLLIQAQAKARSAQAMLVAEVELANGFLSERNRTMWVNNYWPESSTR